MAQLARIFACQALQLLIAAGRLRACLL